MGCRRRRQSFGSARPSRGSGPGGHAVFTLRATVVTEPDRAASLFSFGPRFLVSRDALAATSLIQPGSQISYHTRVVLADDVDPLDWRSRLAATFPKAGWRVRGNNAAPGIQQFIDRMTMFLSFVGLTVLLVEDWGGEHSQQLSGYQDTNHRDVEVPGAPGRMIFYFMAQILASPLLASPLACWSAAASPCVCHLFYWAHAGHPCPRLLRRAIDCGWRIRTSGSGDFRALAHAPGKCQRRPIPGRRRANYDMATASLYCGYSGRSHFTGCFYHPLSH